MHGIDDGTAIDAERGEFDVGNFNEDFFVLLTDDLNLGDVLDTYQFAANAVGINFLVSKAIAFSGKCEDVAESVAKFIVKKRPLASGGQRMTNIADTFSDLVLDARHFRCRNGVVNKEEHQTFAGAGIASDVEVRQFLEAFFNLVGNLLFDFTRRRAWPDGAHRHDLEGERWIL